EGVGWVGGFLMRGDALLCRVWENTPPPESEERPVHDEWEGPKIHARTAVRHRATGMTVEQIEKATDEARIRERIRSKVCESEEDARAIGIAVAEHTEWRRIGYVMEEEGLRAYEPERDPTAVRWAREEQAARLEQAERERQA
ncbi:hypothetical protein, partial [Streptomyces sp. URMC 125]|uniref:hypothetical protein n=1 Tax=Streptomyces sp. URMC 125 TaxID=3423419 RepID=UPI003F19C002